MKIGIYLAYDPLVQSIVNEGLGRYIGVLLRSLQKNGNELVIACPSWFVEQVDDLCKQFNIETDSISVVSDHKPPAIWRLVEMIDAVKTRKRRNLKSRFIDASLTVMGRIASVLFRIQSIFSLALIGLLALVIGILLFIPLSLILLLGVVLRFFLRFTKSSSKKAVSRSIRSVAKYLSYDNQKALISIKKQKFKAYIAEKVRKNTATELVARMNTLKKKPDIWYSPTAFWSEFTSVKGVTATCFPDLTTSVFSYGFTESTSTRPTEIIRAIVNQNKYFIAYCEYQENAMLVNTLGKDQKHVRNIPLFVNETYPYVNITHDLQSLKPERAIKSFARTMISSLYSKTPEPLIRKYQSGTLHAFDMKDMHYVFYSSQLRPNKNVMTLIQAYEYLLRTKEVNFKLVLTASFEHISSVKEYIYDHNLQYDIISFFNVSNQQLAALYACADLVVNPSLYEGGFFMIFSEGMSVGTPSVMSRIPQVTDIVDPYNIDDCLFDPMDYRDIADKILYGVNNREMLVEKQQPIYQDLSRWSREDAGRDYEEAFKYFIELDAQEKKQGKKRKAV